MLRIIILSFCLIPFLGHAQNDVLVLQKRGMHVRSYTVGDPLTFKTIYDQWLTGTIDALRHDTVYIVGQAFSYKEIAAIHNDEPGNQGLGNTLMIIGGGFAVISAVNGLRRGDNAKSWFTTSGYIIAGGLLATGFILSKTAGKNYNMGRKYRLLYLELGRGK